MLSWNVRGLGGMEKRKEVKELVKEKYPFVLCLQETKMQSIYDFVCTSIWGPLNCDYSFSPSVGASGGLLTVWNTSEVEVWASSRMAGSLNLMLSFICSMCMLLVIRELSRRCGFHYVRVSSLWVVVMCVCVGTLIVTPRFPNNVILI